MLRRLRDRPDITEKVGRDIDELLVTLAPDDSVAASAKLFEALRTQEAWPDPEAPAAPPGHVQRKRRRLVIIVAAAIVLFITGFGLRMWTLANGGDLATSEPDLPTSEPLEPNQLIVPMAVGDGNWRLYLADTTEPSPVKPLTNGDGYVVGPVVSPSRRTMMYISATDRGAAARSLRGGWRFRRQG